VAGEGGRSNKNSKDISDVNIVLTTEEEDFTKNSGSQRSLIKKNSLAMGGNINNLIQKITRASIGEIPSLQQIKKQTPSFEKELPKIVI